MMHSFTHYTFSLNKNMLTTNLSPKIKALPHQRFTGYSIPGKISGINTKSRKINTGHGLMRAITDSGERTPIESNNNVTLENLNPSLLDSSYQVKAIVRINKNVNKGLIEKIKDQFSNLKISGGQTIFLQLISHYIDPDTNSGKIVEAYVKDESADSSSSEHLNIDEYTADFTIPSDFGTPGAILITNCHAKEFFLVDVVIQGFQDGPVIFPANSWIHSRNDNPESRIIFRNHTYLPSQTPPGIKNLRREELLSIQGDGTGVRKVHERIYDFAPYNDLGNPDTDNCRPILSGSELPYPRRCRTGRPPAKIDPACESRPAKEDQVYFPRDEEFGEAKMQTLNAGIQKALLRNLAPLIAEKFSSADIPFDNFSEINQLYNDASTIKNKDDADTTKSFLEKVLKQVLSTKDEFLKFDKPAVMGSDSFSWLQDHELARQAVAGVNPVYIELLKEFPIVSKLDPSIYGPPESAITKEVLEERMNGVTVEEAIKNKKLFIIDYHDLYLPFVNKINDLPGSKTYASRAIFFYTKGGALEPIVIELSLPPTQASPPFKRAYTHGFDATSQWIWKLAKAHARNVDIVVHQFVSHLLKVHVCMENYIIATHRQLSQMHPIYKLMLYTIRANATSRKALLTAGGLIEFCYTPGKYVTEISSAAYKSMWRFDMEALPADLLRRGMAVEDPTEPSGLKIVIEDYPFAADGLLIWSAIKDWVESYVAHFYPDSIAITEDIELQEWWDDIKNKGHVDKKDEPWWPKLTTKENLTDILSTIIWVGSGYHAAIHFGQYAFGGYMPNFPYRMRKLIPQENEPDYEEFLRNPEATFLASMPTHLQTTKLMAFHSTGCTHPPDEEYLGQKYSLFDRWTDDQEVKTMYEKFSSQLKEIEEIIRQRNKNTKLMSRAGAGVPPYELLMPTSSPGRTARGIPNSASA